LLSQPYDDLPEHGLDVPFTGDPQRQILQSFEVHDRS
jgi:hypothetical protein